MLLPTLLAVLCWFCHDYFIISNSQRFTFYTSRKPSQSRSSFSLHFLFMSSFLANLYCRFVLIFLHLRVYYSPFHSWLIQLNFLTVCSDMYTIASTDEKGVETCPSCFDGDKAWIAMLVISDYTTLTFIMCKRGGIPEARFTVTVQRGCCF